MRVLKRLLGWGVLAGLSVFLVVAGLVVVNILTYRGLTAETEVATLAVGTPGPRGFPVTLSRSDGVEQQFELTGQEWQLDARMIKWRPWLNVLGNRPLYRLDRLSGRYRDIAQARSARHSVFALSDNPGVDLWALARKQGDWLPGVDAAYGTAVYLPLEKGARYRVSMSVSGLVARPVSGPGRRAIGNWH